MLVKRSRTLFIVFIKSTYTNSNSSQSHYHEFVHFKSNRTIHTHKEMFGLEMFFDYAFLVQLLELDFGSFCVDVHDRTFG